MSTTSQPAQLEPPEGAAATNRPPTRSGLALVVIAAAQLMVVLDGTITNIALPSIQEDLEVSASNLSWVVNSYVLAFGGMLLIGGRVGDLYGRRRMFRLGLVVFATASMLGGLAPNIDLLISARVLQGLGAAVIAPTALSLIATTFSEGAPRNRAMGVYAAMAGLGATAGLLLGGVLTDSLSWRWVLFVNVPIALAVLAGTRLLASGEKTHGELDISGAITGTGGLTALVYAITQGGDRGWGDTITLSVFAIAAVLLATFLRTQARTRHPLLPLRLLRNRNRAGSYATMLFIGASMFATFYFLSLYMQVVKGYSPIEAGFAYLPFSVGMGLSAGLGSRVVGRLPPRLLAGPGLVIAATGMLWFSLLEPSSSYFAHVMPAMFITALGLGASFLPMTLGAVAGVAGSDSGIASAILNAAQQIGGAVGLAVLATVSTKAADSKLPHADAAFFQGLATADLPLVHRAADALTHGYTVAFAAAAGFLLVALIITLVAINAGPQQKTADATPAHLG